MAKKKKVQTVNDRVAAYRERKKAEGLQKIEVHLPEATIRTLDKLAMRDGVTRADFINQLIRAAN